MSVGATLVVTRLPFDEEAAFRLRQGGVDHAESHQVFMDQVEVSP